MIKFIDQLLAHLFTCQALNKESVFSYPRNKLVQPLTFGGCVVANPQEGLLGK